MCRGLAVAVAVAAATLFTSVSPASAEIFVRWTQARVPPPAALGLEQIVLAVERSEAIETAARLGYRVFVEGEVESVLSRELPVPAAGAIVRGSLTDAQRLRIRERLSHPGARVLTVDDRGTWPHVRLNAVSKNDQGVLQVAGRSAQPWLEHNGGLARAARLRERPEVVLAYAWEPLSLADADVGPALAHYLVAIADAGSHGASLLLPLHDDLQRGLLQGRPDAHETWRAIRDALDFYGWALPRAYAPIVDVAVVSADAESAVQTLDLLGRHNLAFEIVEPAALGSGGPGDAVVALGRSAPDVEAALGRDEAAGAIVVRAAEPVADPNAFALDVRNRLGASGRTIDIWNGITVLVTGWRDPETQGVLLELVNYAAEDRPVQVRVRGAFASVHVERPGQPALLIPFTEREGAVEFVVPDLHVSARVLLAPRERPRPKTAAHRPRGEPDR